MKKIVTNDANLVVNFIGVFGNENIRGCHIQYFEQRVVEARENTKDHITSAPNFYAWLWVYAEHVFWDIRGFCYRHGKLVDTDLDMEYAKLVRTFGTLCRTLKLCSNEGQQSEVLRIVSKTLLLRHAFVHRGFPNLLPATSKDKRETKKSREAISWYSNPRNFEEIRAEFNSLRKAMSKAPGVQVEVPGLFSISCGVPTGK